MVSVQNLQEKVLVFQFTTPLVAAFKCVFRTQILIKALTCQLFSQKISRANAQLG